MAEATEMQSATRSRRVTRPPKRLYEDEDDERKPPPAKAQARPKEDRPKQPRPKAPPAEKVQYVDADEGDFEDAGAVHDHDDADASEVSADGSREDDMVEVQHFDRPVMDRAAQHGKAAASPAKGGPAWRKPTAAQGNGAVKGAKAAKPQAKAAPPPAKLQQPMSAATAAQQKAALGAATVRKNAAAKFKECLDVAVKEAGAADADAAPDTAALASAIEAECHSQTGAGAAISQEYRTKFRTLFHALKDGGNADLRARVLSGALPPAELAAKSAAELASKGEAALRRSALEKSNKMTVLDAESAAAFSTAANQSVLRRAREEREAKLAEERRVQREAEQQRISAAEANEAAALAAGRAPLGGGPEHALMRKSMDSAGGSGGFEDFDAFVAARTTASGDAAAGSSSSSGTSSGGGGSSSTSPSPTPRGSPGPAVGEASAPPPASPPAADAAAPTSGGGGDDDDAVTYAPSQRIRPPSADDADRTPPPAATALARSPSVRRSAAAAAGDDGAAAFADVADLAPLVLPTPRGSGAATAPGMRLWSGWLEMPGARPWRAELQSLQGGADLHAVVREGAVTIKGKLPTASLEDFLEQLVASRSRTVTLGVLRVHRGALTDDARAEFDDFVESFRRSDRCGATSPGGYEAYVLPRCDLARRLCATAWLACDGRHRRSVPANVSEHDLLLAVVHTRTKDDHARAKALNARLQKDTAWLERRKRLQKVDKAAREGRRATARAAQAAEDSRRRDNEADAAPPDELPPEEAAPADPRQRRNSGRAPPAATPQVGAPGGLDIDALAASVLRKAEGQRAGSGKLEPTSSGPPHAASAFDLGQSLASLASVIGSTGGGGDGAASALDLSSLQGICNPAQAAKAAQAAQAAAAPPPAAVPAAAPRSPAQPATAPQPAPAQPPLAGAVPVQPPHSHPTARPAAPWHSGAPAGKPEPHPYQPQQVHPSHLHHQAAPVPVPRPFAPQQPAAHFAPQRLSAAHPQFGMHPQPPAAHPYAPMPVAQPHAGPMRPPVPAPPPRPRMGQAAPGPSDVWPPRVAGGGPPHAATGRGAGAPHMRPHVHSPQHGSHDARSRPEQPYAPTDRAAAPHGGAQGGRGAGSWGGRGGGASDWQSGEDIADHLRAAGRARAPPPDVLAASRGGGGAGQAPPPPPPE